MSVGRGDVGVHDGEMAMGQVARIGGGRNKMRPCVPSVDKRLGGDVGTQIVVSLTGSHRSKAARTAPSMFVASWLQSDLR